MYKITITEVKAEETKERGQWQVIDETFFTEKDYDNLTGIAKNNFSTEDLNKLKKPVYGYPPERTVTREVETKILEQTIEKINLTNVIKAINEIS